MSKVLKAQLHYYRYNVIVPEERRAYEEMAKKIAANEPEARGKWMKCIPSFDKDKRGREDNTTEEVEVELEHIFDNQWNTKTMQVFDWYEEAIYSAGKENKNIKRGHWLELTPELAAVRKATWKCCYCGAQYGEHHTPKTGDFCTQCLDSKYLKKEDLRLLRLRRLSVPDHVITELTEEEMAFLLPLYVERQTVSRDSRAVAAREREMERIEKDYKEAIKAAETKYQGFKWLYGKGIKLSNVIYYSHTDRFCFGWQNKVSPEVESAILKVISEFPYQYTIECADGRKLENYLDE